MEDNTADNGERIVAAVFLLTVLVMQIFAALVSTIQGSAGRCGRFLYYFALVLSVIHDAFTGLVVPISLIWVAAELFAGSRDVEALLAAIVGTLWYGPERVQTALYNLWHTRLRCRVLHAALGPYHRSAVITGVDGNPLPAVVDAHGNAVVDAHGNAVKVPLPVRRELRAAPWWSAQESNAKLWWHGRVIEEGAEVVLRDTQLRAVARKGASMALLGDVHEDSVRAWCAAMVADQARFRGSPLKKVKGTSLWKLSLEGYEGLQLRKAMEEHGREWTDDEWSRLAKVAEGIRNNGIQYLKQTHWVV